VVDEQINVLYNAYPFVNPAIIAKGGVGHEGSAVNETWRAGGTALRGSA
jgi:hypothetical protein